jgi:hypothetical protein
MLAGTNLITRRTSNMDSDANPNNLRRLHTLRQRCALRAGPSRTSQDVHGLPSCPLADGPRGPVHADSHSRRKCAKRGSNRLDLADDMLRVLQAMPRNLQVTEPSNQLRAAPLLLTSRTRVESYRNRSGPVDPPETGGDRSYRRLHHEDGAKPGLTFRNAVVGLGGLRQRVSLDDRFNFPLCHKSKSFVEIFGAVLLAADDADALRD